MVGKPTCQLKLPGSTGNKEKGGDADTTRLGFPDGITEQDADREGGEGAVVLWC